MPGSGKRDQLSDAPKWRVDFHNHTGKDLYGTEVYGVDATETHVSKKVAHSGWVRRVRGYGALLSLAVANGGSNTYANTDTWKIPASVGTANATGNVVTDANGVIIGVTYNTKGAGFYGTESATITGATGVNGALTATYTGRANRILTEVIDAKGIANDATDFVGGGANTSGSADDAVFPDA